MVVSRLQSASDNRDISLFDRFLCDIFPFENGREFPEALSLPPLRHAVDDLGVFVAGEAEVDEPFLVEQPRRLLQQLYAPPVVLDQVVIGGKDGGD